MNAPATQQLPAIGTAMEGGFFVGQILIPDHGMYGLIKAPKAAGELARVQWGSYDDDVQGALSLVDGLANTKAMAESGSKLARRILDLKIDGRDDWYLPALDELDVIYRHCKPTTEENAMYARSGINLHAVPAPTPPHTKDLPAQTSIDIFRAGGAEAFETDDSYWTSTQSAGNSSCAWGQWFLNGVQYDWLKDDEYRACAVRRFKL